MNVAKRAGYVIFIGALTGSAASACYWQSKRYIQARDRWDVIRKELSKDTPEDLSQVNSSHLYPFKYVVVRGKLEDGHVRIDRARNGRMGYLIVRSLSFTDKQG